MYSEQNQDAALRPKEPTKLEQEPYWVKEVDSMLNVFINMPHIECEVAFKTLQRKLADARIKRQLGLEEELKRFESDVAKHSEGTNSIVAAL